MSTVMKNSEYFFKPMGKQWNVITVEEFNKKYSDLNIQQYSWIKLLTEKSNSTISYNIPDKVSDLLTDKVIDDSSFFDKVNALDYSDRVKAGVFTLFETAYPVSIEMFASNVEEYWLEHDEKVKERKRSQSFNYKTGLFYKNWLKETSDFDYSKMMPLTDRYYFTGEKPSFSTDSLKYLFMMNDFIEHAENDTTYIEHINNPLVKEKIEQFFIDFNLPVYEHTERIFKDIEGKKNNVPHRKNIKKIQEIYNNISRSMYLKVYTDDAFKDTPVFQANETVIKLFFDELLKEKSGTVINNKKELNDALYYLKYLALSKANNWKNSSNYASLDEEMNRLIKLAAKRNDFNGIARLTETLINEHVKFSLTEIVALMATFARNNIVVSTGGNVLHSLMVERINNDESLDIVHFVARVVLESPSNRIPAKDLVKIDALSFNLPVEMAFNLYGERQKPAVGDQLKQFFEIAKESE